MKNQKHNKLVDMWQKELEDKSKLVFGHMCNSKIFRKMPIIECCYCKDMDSRGYDHKSYNWHITEEKYLFELIKGADNV